MRELRNAKVPRWTQSVLARRMLEVEGDPDPHKHRVNAQRQIVSAIERPALRKRSATIGELTIIALALDVSPLALLAPDRAGSRVLVGATEISAAQMREWFRGARKPFVGDPTWFETHQGEERSIALERVPEIRRLLAFTEMAVQTAGHPGSQNLYGLANACNSIVNVAEGMKLEAAAGLARIEDVAPPDSQPIAQRFEKDMIAELVDGLERQGRTARRD